MACPVIEHKIKAHGSFGTSESKGYLLEVELKTLAGDEGIAPIFEYPLACELGLAVLAFEYDPPPPFDECGVEALLQYPPRGLTLLLVPLW